MLKCLRFKAKYHKVLWFAIKEGEDWNEMKIGQLVLI